MLSPFFSTLLLAASSVAGLQVNVDVDVEVNATVAAPKVASAWYAGWHSEDFPLSKVPWSKYTQMTYAFAMTTPDVNQLTLEGSNPALLPEFVATAKKNGVIASLSIGGWTGSRYFSTAVATASNRTMFVKTVTDIATKYKLDAIDFDWEYPNRQGLGCNTIDGNDTPNFLLFLQELRTTTVGKKLLLTAAVSITPFNGASGTPLSDVAAFGKVLDYIVPMVYDINGSWSTSVAANAPIIDTCAPAANQAGSATSAIAAWTAAGVPANKLVLGVPGYGHSFHVSKANAYNGTALASYPPFDKSKQPSGDRWDDAAGVDPCGVATGPGGNWNYWGLIAGGFITPDGLAAPGMDYRFDTCTKTPYIYDPKREIMVSYDNVASFAEKGKFIAKNGLLGFAMWEAGGDQQSLLVNSIRKSAGFKGVY